MKLETDLLIGQSIAGETGRVSFRLNQPIFVDEYARNRITGSFILIDEMSGGTVGVGVITAARALNGYA